MINDDYTYSVFAGIFVWKRNESIMRIYPFFFFFLLIFSITCCTSTSKDDADGNKLRTVSFGEPVTEESNAKAKEAYDAAVKKWKTHNITSYTMKVLYAAFSPTSGIWEVKVENGKVTSCTFEKKDKSKTDESVKCKWTMDYFFDLANWSYQNRPDAPFVIRAGYDEKLGYVKFIQNGVNPGCKEKIPGGRTYKYEVIEFTYD